MKNIVICLLLLSACAKLSKDLNRQEVHQWNIEDQGVVYPIKRVGRIKGKKYFNMQSIFLTPKKEKVVENLKVLSTRGLLKNKMQVLRPEYAYMELWVDKQQFISKLELDEKKRAFNVHVKNEIGMRSFTVTFPKTPRLVCFFSQLTECLRVTGFFDKVQEFHAGNAKIMLIMEGAFLYSSLYEYYPKQLFVPAEFHFDGFDRQQHMKFTLSFQRQNIYFTVDKFFKFYSMYWVAQQLNIVPIQK